MWIQISSGRGPIECQRAVYLYVDVLLKELKNCEILSVEEGIENGIFLSAMLKCETDSLQDINGIIKWICPSPYRKNHKRKNRFISVEYFKEVIATEYSENDFKIETMRSGGSCGQNVNKVETAVRVTHIKSGLSVVGREERSQMQNRKLAISRLLTLLTAHENDKKSILEKNVWMQHNEL